MPLGDYGTALVTGASSGIGRATARALAAEGLTVHAVARRADRLDALTETPGIVPHSLDVRDTVALHDLLPGLGIDVLVNNAGTARGLGGLAAASPEDIETTIGTNVTAVCHILRAVLPGMIERRCGHIVSLDSVVGVYPISSALYGGSKGAIRTLTPNLRIELKGTDIRVTEICPGRVHTKLFDRAFDDRAEAARVRDAGIDELAPEDIADAIRHGISAPRRINITTLEIAPTEQSFGSAHLTPRS